MNRAPDELIAQAQAVARTGDSAGAIALADDLVRQHEADFRVWSLRAYLRSRESAHLLAITDLSSAVALNDLEPASFFERGRCALNLGEWDAAERDLRSDDYYRQTLHFFRAEARVKKGLFQEALHDLNCVGDGFSFWTNRLVTKQVLIAECLDHA